MSKPRDVTYIKKPVIFPHIGNSLYPLPPDYESLTEDGKRLARVNASSIYRAPGATPDHLVVSWHFFTQYYLHWEDANFFELAPGQEKPLRTPDFHHQIVRSLGEFGASAIAAPRGGAKSTVIDQEIMQMIYTNFNFSMTLMLAVGRMIQKRFSKYKFQILDNRRLNDDFGQLAPLRHESPFRSDGLFILRNRVTLEGIPMDGRARGARPGIFFLDDPEYDPEGTSTDMSAIRRHFARTLFKVIVPMMRKNCPIQWVGTVISRQHMMWLAWAGQDPRFGSWHRILLPAILENGEPLWPEWRDESDIERLRRTMGSAAVDAEFFNMPGESEGSTFHLGEQHFSYLDGNDFEMEEGDPWKSNATVLIPSRVLLPGGGIVRLRHTAQEWLASMPRRFVFVDAAISTSAEADYTAILAVGVTGDNRIQVLDAKIARLNEEDKINSIIQMAMKWRVTVIACEDVPIQRSLNERLSTRFVHEQYNTDVVPFVLEVRPQKGYTKIQRISGALRWRFDNNLILFPGWRRYEASMQMLLEQVSNFNEQMENGGLSFIDGLDALAYCQIVVRGRVEGNKPEEPKADETIIDRLRNGEYFDAMGNDIRPLIFSLPNVPKDVVEKVLESSAPREPDPAHDVVSGALTDADSRF